MGIGAGLYMCDVVVKKFTFAISSLDEFLLHNLLQNNASWNALYVERGLLYI